MAEGTGIRAYDGFWLTLPTINVPVEGTVFAALTESGAVVIRWTVGSLAEVAGFNVYRATAEEGPFEPVNADPLPCESPGSYEDKTVWPETTFWYEVRALLADGTEQAVAGPSARVTTGGRLVLRLYPLRPNPSAGPTTVRFDIPNHTGPVELAIHNVQGQRVKTFADVPTQRGRHEMVWDGTDDSGRTIASGVYFTTLRAGEHADNQKVLILR
jgi:hypothetical protein